MVKKRQLGTSELLVSELGFGCMSLPLDQQQANYIIDAAIDRGITFFDTADLYAAGQNEEFIGDVLKNRRQQIVLATKVGNKMQPDGKNWTWDSSKAHIMEAVKKSLQRLQTDVIDLYQLHGGTMEDNVEDTIEAFEALKKEGIIREYGISSIRPNVIERFLTSSDAVSVMMQYSLLDRRPEEYFSLIKTYGASVITRGTVAKGLLTKEALERIIHSNGFGLYTQAQLEETIHQLDAETDNLHAAAIAFALHNSVVASALVGARTIDQLMTSIEAYEKRVSFEQLLPFIKAHQYEEHRTLG